MDRDGPDMPAKGDAGHRLNEAPLASGASARVGAILSKAEVRAKSIRAQAERSASDTRRTARHESERIAQDARLAAEAAARDRVRRISELRASIAARGGSLVEGLEGGELTAARLDELVAALGEAADRVLVEIAGGAAAAKPVGNGVPAPAAPVAPRGPAAHAAPAPRPPVADTHDGRPAPISDPLPEGAPIARRPARSNARFAAVLMAIQGSDRREVAERLARDHGLDDADELLDDVFGRADAPA